jgi:hypothetical protein
VEEREGGEWERGIEKEREKERERYVKYFLSSILNCF